MALKDWKLYNKTEYSLDYVKENPFNGKKIFLGLLKIEPSIIESEKRYLVHVNHISITPKLIKTKSEALKIIKNYMRKN